MKDLLGQGFIRPSASVGISVESLGVATGPGLAWGSTGTSGPSARTSVTALGGLQLDTSELFGEDPTGIIRIDASQVMR